MGNRDRLAAAALAALVQAGCGSAPPPPPVAHGPVEAYVEGDVAAQAVPGLSVEVRVIAIHSTIGSAVIPRWIVVTRGLESTRGHAELSLMIRREDDEPAEAYPRDAVTVLAELAGKVAAGQHLKTWQLLDVPRGFLGRPDFAGMVVAPGDTPGYTVPRPPLSLIAITAEELQVARRFGAGRIVGLLGLRYHHYPTGTWIERKRPPVATAAALQQSQLDPAASTVVLDDAAIWHEPARASEGAAAGRVVILQLGWAAAAALENAMRLAGSQGTLMAVAPPAGNTDVSLIWSADRRELAALGRPGRQPVRYAATFLAFPQQPDKPGARLVEDGYVVQMTRDQLVELRKALRKHRPFAVAPAADRHAFELRWSSCVVQVYVNDANRLPDCLSDPSRAYVPEDEEEEK